MFFYVGGICACSVVAWPATSRLDRVVKQRMYVAFCLLPHGTNYHCDTNRAELTSHLPTLGQSASNHT